MAITSEKLLNRPSELHRRYGGRLAMQKALQEKMVSGGPKNIVVSKKELNSIKVKVIQIKDLISTTTLLKKAEEETKRKEAEKKEFSERESKLEESKGDDKQEKIKLPAAPRLGFLDRIKKFLFNVLLGYIVYRLIPHIPKLAGLAKSALNVVDFMANVGVGLVDGLATFVQKGYEAYDFTRKTLKNFGGDNVVKLFDAFNGAVGKVIEASIIAALAFGELGDGGGPGGGPDAVGIRGAAKQVGRSRYGTSAAAARRYAERYGIDAARKKFGSDAVKSLGGKYARSGVTNLARKGLVGALGKGGAKAALKVLKPILGNLPLIGGLLEFAISWATGDPVGKAAFRGIGAGLIGAVGTAIGGPIGLAIGGFVGGEIGGALYDVFFGKKNKEKEKTRGYAGGGNVTRAGKLYTGPKRGIKKTPVKREVKIEPTKLKPGADAGGEEKIGNTVSVDYSEEFYKTNSKIPFFGPMFAIATKAYAGDKPNQVDYKNAGAALNSWITTTFNSDTLRGGIAFAEGGQVNAEMLMKGDDLTDVIAKSLEDNISKRVDTAINELKNQIKLGGLKGMKDIKEGEGQEDSLTVDIDGAEITGGDADFWTLVAIASREDGDPQAWADVAQSIYNRLGSGAYSGKTIRELILGQMQYEPTWKYPKPGRTGYPNAEWKVIKDAASAAAASGQSEGAMKSVAAALLNPTLQKNARDFIQGRTDFRGYSVSGGVTRKAGDNYFGWYNNYKGTQVASVPNFGASASPGAGGSLASGGKFIQGNSGASAGVHFHIGPGSQTKGTILQRQYFADARATAKQAIDYFLGKGSRVYDGRRGVYYKSGNEVAAAQQAHTGSGSAGGIDMQVDFEKPVAFPLKTTGMSYRPNGFGVSADIIGSNSFVAHGRYDERGKVAPQERMKLYGLGGLVRGFTRAILGERGIEFVLDTDTTTALEQNFPGFLNALNKANYDGAINVLRNYASYESGASVEVEVEQPEPEIVYVPMVGSTPSTSVSVRSSPDSSYDSSYERG